MSRFDKTELEGVIESMEKLLQEETAASVPEPVAGSSVGLPSDGVAGVPPPVADNQSTSPAATSPSTGVSGISGPPAVPVRIERASCFFMTF